MFLNFVIFVIAATSSIWLWYKKDIGTCLLDIVIALINLPFAIEWVVKYFT